MGFGLHFLGDIIVSGTPSSCAVPTTTKTQKRHKDQEKTEKAWPVQTKGFRQNRITVENRSLSAAESKDQEYCMAFKTNCHN